MVCPASTAGASVHEKSDAGDGRDTGHTSRMSTMPQSA